MRDPIRAACRDARAWLRAGLDADEWVLSCHRIYRGRLAPLELRAIMDRVAAAEARRLAEECDALAAMNRGAA